MKEASMDIEIDLGKCQGYAQCVHEAPETFELSESGRAQIVVAGVTHEYEKYAQAAADLCPMQAISINGH
jgi:ferredoxin